MDAQALQNEVDLFENKILSASRLEWNDIYSVLQKLSEDNDKGLKGCICYYAAYSKMTDGIADDSLYFLNESIRFLLGTDKEHYVTRCYNLLGILAHSQNNLILAMEQYSRALSYAQKYYMETAEGMILANMADICHRVGTDKKAAEYYEAFLHCIDEEKLVNQNDRINYYKAVSGYGFVLICLSEKEKAQDIFNRLEKLDTEFDDSAANLAIYCYKAFYNKRYISNEKYDEYIKAILEIISEGVVVNSCFDQLYNIITMLVEFMDYGNLQVLLDNVIPLVAINGNENVLLEMLYYQLKFCSGSLDSKEFTQNTQTFFKLKSKYEKNENSQLVKMMKMRNKLVDMEEIEDELKEKNSKLLYQVDHDVTSGLFNRRYLNAYAETSFEKAYHDKTSFGVLFVDIDYFKKVNDSHGHTNGDSAILRISNVLKKIMKDDFVARYGGDEFVILILDKSKEYLEECATRIIEEVKELKIPTNRDKEDDYVSVTIGGYHDIPQKNSKVWDFLKAADNCLYEQKEIHRGSIRIQK